MKKLGIFALAAALASFTAIGSSRAAESAAGGLEFSGNVDVVTGWQHDDGGTYDPLGSCPNGLGGLGCNAIDTAGSGSGQLGDFRGLATPNRDTFNFYLDQVELDLQKTFGENIRLRADLDFGRFLSGSFNTTASGLNPTSAFNLEQGYVTANIPVGNGMEFLIGRFNAPIGLESVDRPDNITLSFSDIYRYVRPHNVTGAKIYYAFNNWFDWSVYLVNNLSDSISFAAGTDSAIPSWGTRFGFTWGAEGQKSTLGLSYAGGPEQNNNNAHLTHILDLDFLLHVTKNFRIGGEGIYRQDNVVAALEGLTPNSKAIGGQLVLAYAPSETWDFFFRYDYLHDINPTAAYTGVDQQINAFSVGTTYQITDGAKMKLEYRLDLHNYATNQGLPGILAVPPAVTLADTSSIQNAFSAEFAYNF
jgi:putative OmpL-like beta-barrel porin-2